jgi:hypothetical protein
VKSKKRGSADPFGREPGISKVAHVVQWRHAGALALLISAEGLYGGGCSDSRPGYFAPEDIRFLQQNVAKRVE